MIVQIHFTIGQLQYKLAFHWSFILYDVIFYGYYKLLLKYLYIFLYFFKEVDTAHDELTKIRQQYSEKMKDFQVKKSNIRAR